MADAEQVGAPQPAAEATAAPAGPSLLEQAIKATKQTERSRAEELLKTLTEEALKGTITYSKNIGQTLEAAISGIDRLVSKQLNAVMHSESFRKLEGSWRGL